MSDTKDEAFTGSVSRKTNRCRRRIPVPDMENIQSFPPLETLPQTPVEPKPSTSSQSAASTTNITELEPSVVIAENINIQEVRQIMAEINITEFCMEKIRYGKIIYLCSLEDRQLLCQKLTALNRDFYLYAPGGALANHNRYVIKGIPTELLLEEVIEAFAPLQATGIRRLQKNTPAAKEALVCPIVITVPPGVTAKDIKTKVRAVDHFLYRVEIYIPRRNSLLPEANSGLALDHSTSHRMSQQKAEKKVQPSNQRPYPSEVELGNNHSTGLEVVPVHSPALHIPPVSLTLDQATTLKCAKHMVDMAQSMVNVMATLVEAVSTIVVNESTLSSSSGAVSSVRTVRRSNHYSP